MFIKGMSAYIRGLSQDSTDQSAPTVTAATLDTVPSTLQPDQTAAAPAPAAPSGGWFDSLMATVQKLTPVALSVVQQAQMTSVNAQRAAKGLAPLTAAQYQAQYGTPTATVQASLAPQTQTLVYVVGGALAIALAVGMGRRR